MPKPSNPTTNEARVLAAAIDSSGASKASLAEALDVSPGLISQFASGHRPVPWDKAEQLGRLLSVNPAAISSAYREIERHFGKAVPRSQPARLNPEMLAESIEALRRVWARRGLVFDPVTQPEMVVYAYELLAEMGEERTTAQLIDFGAKLAERDKAKAGIGDGREEDKQSSGVDRTRAKGSGRKPA